MASEANHKRWRPGDVIVRREVLRGRPWAAIPVYVVHDDADLLALYLPEGAPFGFADAGLAHPWLGRSEWAGHGPLMLHRPGDAYAVWAFWEGADRRFAGWYVNFQAPFRRTRLGIDTLDHELDIWIADGAAWAWKDEDKLRPGARFTAAEVEAIRAEADAVARDLDAGHAWWDGDWASWRPDRDWGPPALRPDWAAAA
jgi:hypothetical protein